jgi:hypothetical protein
MRPVVFVEQSVVYGQGQDEYLPLPVHRGPAPEVVVTSCWQMSDEDLAELKRNGGRVWLQQLTFGNALQPQIAMVFKPDLPLCPE